jgi:hypothetical protein
MDGGWGFPIHHFLYFTGIDGYSVTRNGMAQEFYCIQPKLTLGEFGVQMVVSQPLKDDMKMFNMIFWSFRIDKSWRIP